MVSITKVYCDICKKEAKCYRKDMQMVFTTETTEGRSVEPYLETTVLDLCDDCLNKIIKNHSLFASGAQGNNDYTIKENNNG